MVTAVITPDDQLHHHPHNNPPPTPTHQQITVLSANLCHDWPRYRQQKERLERLAALAEREAVDVLLLQEVSRTPKLHVDQWLAQRLGMAAVYSRANGQAANIGFEEGVAILSRWPLTAPKLQILGHRRNPFVRRLALTADMMTANGRLALFSVHLGLLPSHNARQLNHLLHWVAALTPDRPALIGGDFNAHEQSARIRQVQQTWQDPFRQLHPQAKGITHELRARGKIPLSRRRLDYIFFKPHQQCWQTAVAYHLHAHHSDHQAVLLRLQAG